MSVYAITNLITTLTLLFLSALLVYLMVSALYRKEVPQAFRWLYILRAAVGAGWFILFAYALTFDNFVFPSIIGAWFVRPGLISTLVVLVLGHLLCRE